MRKPIGFSAMELTLLIIFGSLLLLGFIQDRLARRADWQAHNAPIDPRLRSF
jgi:hypothetical protein